MSARSTTVSARIVNKGVRRVQTGIVDPTELAEFGLSLQEIDTDVPSPARIYDYWLGGSHNFAVDREVGRQAAEAMPTLRAAIMANRAFLHRMVAHLVAQCRITQFLDLGSGVPTVGNVHEIAQSIDPEVRVVYVDIDPVAVAHGRHLLTDNPRAVAILADLRRPASVLSHPQVQATLDLNRPVAVLMNAVLHFIPDSEDPAGIVAAYTAAIAPGSYLALSHAAPDLVHPDEQAGMIDDYQQSTGVQFIHRTPQQLAAWLGGLEVQPPGIVLVNQWRPDTQGDVAPILRTHGLLARKPHVSLAVSPTPEV
jgi:S-adenosyl methyltransferase